MLVHQRVNRKQHQTTFKKKHIKTSAVSLSLSLSLFLFDVRWSFLVPPSSHLGYPWGGELATQQPQDIWRTGRRDGFATGNHGGNWWGNCTCFLKNIHKNQSNGSIRWKQHWKNHGLIQANMTDEDCDESFAHQRPLWFCWSSFWQSGRKRGVNLWRNGTGTLSLG